LPRTVVRSATAVDDAPTDDTSATIERIGFGGAGVSKTPLLATSCGAPGGGQGALSYEVPARDPDCQDIA